MMLDYHIAGNIANFKADGIKKRDSRAINVISAAVPESNIVTVTGGSLTAVALNATLAIIDDKDLALKYLVLRGSRFNDMREWDLDPVTERKLLEKGIIKLYAGASVIKMLLLMRRKCF